MTLGVGIIGCGNISGIYMQNLPAYTGVSLRACADMKPEVAKAQAELHGIDPMTVDALLARKDIDIVVNLTIPNAHYDVAMSALAAGKHVFGEKPLCAEHAQGQRLLAEAGRRGLRVGCAPDTFLGPGGGTAREIVDSGKIGKVLSGTVVLLTHGMEHWHPDPEFFFKPGGGPVLDIGPYYFAALANILGPAKSVTARGFMGFAERKVTAPGPRTGDRIKVETPTSLSAIIHYHSGTDIVLMMSWDVWKHGHPRLELYGTEGSLRIPDPNFYGGLVEYTEQGGDWIGVDPSTRTLGVPNWRAPMWGPNMPAVANYRGLGVAELASAVSRGTPHRASGALAAHILEIMHGILTSAETGRTVEMTSRIERPAPLAEADAAALWKGR